MFFKHIQRFVKNQKRVYLDFASSTPLDRKMLATLPEVDNAVLGANPSALHHEGVQARSVVEAARRHIAALLHAHADEIFFTSGATESDNLALVGSIEAMLKNGLAITQIAVATSILEHAAVTECLLPYVEKGLFLVQLPVDDGVVQAKMIDVPKGCKALVVTIMYVNNEIGTVQPIRDIAKRIRRLRKDNPETTILLHTDATQAPLYYSLRTDQLGIDMLTLGATKLYTHKGVGVLYKKRTTTLVPLVRGGGQESGMRPGTESVALIHAFAHALMYAQTKYESETVRMGELQTYFEQLIHQHIPEAYVTAQMKERSSHISHVVLKGIESELLVIELDARGIAVSAKSACKNEEGSESPLLESLYGKGYGAVRFSFGRQTKKGDLDRAVKALRKILDKYKIQPRYD